MDKKTKMIIWIAGIVVVLIIIIAIVYEFTKPSGTGGVNAAKPISASNPPAQTNWLVSAINGATTLGGDFINTGGLSGNGNTVAPSNSCPSGYTQGQGCDPNNPGVGVDTCGFLCL